jgi:two-component system alkaline phosphatase synthesis response regulator PhoP
MDRPVKVLVVDDEQDILETLDYSLALRGYEVVTAADGLEAIERAKRTSPDIVILDVMLPGCNGYEVSRLLKEWMENDPAAEAFPILLLTARKVDTPEREKFIATWSRADGCMYKPFDMDELLNRIDELTGTVAVPA